MSAMELLARLEQVRHDLLESEGAAGVGGVLSPAHARGGVFYGHFTQAFDANGTLTSFTQEGSAITDVCAQLS